MNAVISFVEYLFTGILALPWLLLIIDVDTVLKDMGAMKLPVIVVFPILYAVGMILDYLSRFLLSVPRGRIREMAVAKYQPPDLGVASRKCAITVVAPELAGELAAMSTRDRIARGLFLNLSILSVVVALFVDASSLGIGKWGLFIVSSAFAIFSFYVWWGCEHLTRRLRYRAFKTLHQLGKINIDTP